MSNKSRVSLDILRRLVSELETSLETAEAHALRTDGQEDFIVEMSKASGLAGGIMQEGSMLVMDIALLVKTTTGPLTSTAGLDLSMPPIKGGTGNTN